MGEERSNDSSVQILLCDERAMPSYTILLLLTPLSLSRRSLSASWGKASEKCGSKFSDLAMDYLPDFVVELTPGFLVMVFVLIVGMILIYYDHKEVRSGRRGWGARSEHSSNFSNILSFAIRLLVAVPGRDGAELGALLLLRCHYGHHHWLRGLQLQH